MLRRLVTWSYDRRRRVVALWVAALVAATVLAGVAGGDNEVDFTVPGSDSADAVELLQDRFPVFAGGNVDVVYTADGGVTGSDVTGRIDRLAAELGDVPNVVAADPGPVSPDGSTGVVQVRFDLPGSSCRPRRSNASWTSRARPRATACGSSSGVTPSRRSSSRRQAPSLWGSWPPW